MRFFYCLMILSQIGSRRGIDFWFANDLWIKFHIILALRVQLIEYSSYSFLGEKRVGLWLITNYKRWWGKFLLLRCFLSGFNLVTSLIGLKMEQTWQTLLLFIAHHENHVTKCFDNLLIFKQLNSGALKISGKTVERKLLSLLLSYCSHG